MSIGSIFGRNAALDACYGSGHASSWPATVYLHLYVGNPMSGGSELTSAGSYAAVSIANDTTHWPAASNGQKSNGAVVTFPTSSGAWSGGATYAWLTDMAAGLARPAPPTVTNVGAAGTTTYTYEVTALNAVGETIASPPTATTTGNNILDGTNYNHIAWTAVTGATSYNIYKLIGGVYLLLASTGSTTYNDQGATAALPAAPISDTTMNLLDGGPLSGSIIVPGTGYTVLFPAASIVIATS